MRQVLSFLGIVMLLASCLGDRDNVKLPGASALTATVSPLATIKIIGADTLSDSSSVHHLQPEPDGGSIAFLFTDPVKGITRGLAIVELSRAQEAQLAWPDSVTSVWWSGPHQISFTAGTGQGVRVVVDVHMAQLQALEGSESPRPTPAPQQGSSTRAALARAQAFVDSVRVQPQGTPQGSTLRYRADSVLLAPGDTFAAVHVLASDPQGTQVNPAWYLTHLPSGHVHGLDSLTGRSSGLLSAAGSWGAPAVFYYVKERVIWQARVGAQ
jgi:hypothetical protein